MPNPESSPDPRPLTPDPSFLQQSLGRRWLALDCNRDYLIGSAFRFMADCPDDDWIQSGK